MTTDVLRGSCLCGAVTFEVAPPFLRFAHCHCSRCQKATGAAHASNLYAEPDRFRWTSGSDEVVRYDLPTAGSFATTFCRSCGAPLPRRTRSGREVVVPAGSLDELRELRPQMHIFWASRPVWSCAEDELPRHDEYGPGWRAPTTDRR